MSARPSLFHHVEIGWDEWIRVVFLAAESSDAALVAAIDQAKATARGIVPNLDPPSLGTFQNEGSAT